MSATNAPKRRVATTGPHDAIQVRSEGADRREYGGVQEEPQPDGVIRNDANWNSVVGGLMDGNREGSMIDQF
jgi:hypothetical protein